MTKRILFSIFLFFIAFACQLSAAELSLGEILRGRILLQVEEYGEAWYIHPQIHERLYLGRPSDALVIMREQGLGITNENLNRLPINLDSLTGIQSDNDGLPDDLENALGTDINKNDSDNDGFDDLVELKNGYDPLKGNGAKLPLDQGFANLQKGKILLQVENNGEAWYVNPINGERYFLGRPADAFNIMRHLGLGITNENLDKIIIYKNGSSTGEEPITEPHLSAKETLDAVAKAFRESNKTNVLKYTTDDIQFMSEHAFDFLTKEERFDLGNLLSGAELVSSTDSEVVYSAKIQLLDWETDYQYHLVKQADGIWKLANL